MTTTGLDWISVSGFRSIAQLEQLPLGPINVLIGANGSGKSNLIQVFALLRAWQRGRLDQYVALTGGADRNLHFGAKVTTRLAVGVLFKDEKTYDVEFQTSDDDRLVPDKLSAGPAPKSLPGDDETMKRVMLFKEMQDQRLKQWRVYHFHDTGKGAPLLKTAYLGDNEFLREDGENLAPFLYYLKHREKTSYKRIQQTFRLVAPFFDDFILEPMPENEQMLRLGWCHRTSDARFDISGFSDGTLRFLALATLLLQPAHLRPPIILLDEPELGLHPYAITLLCSLIQSVAVETQVILATQAPFLVDQFDPEDVIVVDRVDGRSEFRRLSSEKLKSWLENYSLGDLWLKNELGGRPAYEAPAQEHD